MSEDWFRKTTWTESDERDFFHRLNRSRQYNRSQYVRIQACHLADVGERETTEAALALLEILFDRFPDRLEMASAYLQKAECLVSLGRIEESIDFFKKSIDFERHFPNVSTQAPLEYGLVVVERKLSNEYTSVLDILEEFEEDVSTFPVDRFYVAGIRAIIHSEIGNLTLARTFAKQALVEAAKEHSGFRNHPKLGLVGTRDVELLNILEQIATYDGTK